MLELEIYFFNYSALHCLGLACLHVLQCTEQLSYTHKKDLLQPRFLNSKKNQRKKCWKKKIKYQAACCLCFLSVGTQWRVSVSIYILMSPSIFARAREGFIFSTMMLLTNLSSLSGRHVRDTGRDSKKKLESICPWCLLSIFIYVQLVRCNLCIQTGAHELCFHFTERWGNMFSEKALLLLSGPCYWLKTKLILWTMGFVLMVELHYHESKIIKLS